MNKKTKRTPPPLPPKKQTIDIADELVIEIEDNDPDIIAEVDVLFFNAMMEYMSSITKSPGPIPGSNQQPELRISQDGFDSWFKK